MLNESLGYLYVFVELVEEMDVFPAHLPYLVLSPKRVGLDIFILTDPYFLAFYTKKNTQISRLWLSKTSFRFH